MNLATSLKDELKNSFKQIFDPTLNHHSKSFTCVISFNLHDNFMVPMLVLILQIKKSKLKGD